jgi:Flp pilus assembly protein TadG
VSGRRPFARDERGASALEFAFVLPLLAVLTVGGLQLAWALHCASSVRWSLETSARALVLDPQITADQVRSVMLSRLGGTIDPSAVTVALTPDMSTPGVRVIRATSTYQATLAVAFLPAVPLRFSATTTVPAPAPPS